VKLPPGEDLNEWIAANSKSAYYRVETVSDRIMFCLSFVYFFLAVDFYNELSLMWGIICDNGIQPMPAGAGFPPDFQYYWAGGTSSIFKSSAPASCSGPQYIEHVMNWVDKEINNDSLFPTNSCKFYNSEECFAALFLFVLHSLIFV
jgi:MOB kinase activator 1